ncbi:putative quinol monooxygenase [Altericroceibacterium endophyticum]|uniref:Antibiotic biosynthesis monooxygenase n=1 Tax=Altericroceibacterium endophyticum TaxID=1808508 RepID=A0A6I4T7E8_9SPHN|nr:putative quinol monooxygenase [Altericroceibacterium endophyticum]MXO66886.1 antibiotic biosynthesis monooxygenase [Altericroceibacterium endophyticum]
MLCVIGHFRFPPEKLAEAQTLMQAVIEATRQEAGCLSYSYAEDVTEPGLFRVTEIWDSHDSLLRHFASPHMHAWSEARAELGFYDRDITAYELGQAAAL